MSETTIDADASRARPADRTAATVSLLVLRMIVGVILSAAGGRYSFGRCRPLPKARDADRPVAVLQ